MFQPFDVAVTVMVTESATSDTDAAGTCSPSRTTGAWISSEMIRASYFAAMSASSRRRSAVNVKPNGLFGLHRIRLPAPSAKAFSTAAGSGPSGRVGTWTMSRSAAGPTSKKGM